MMSYIYIWCHIWCYMHAYDIICDMIGMHMTSIPTLWCQIWCHSIAYDVICDIGQFLHFVKFLLFLDPLLTTKCYDVTYRCYDVRYDVICDVAHQEDKIVNFVKFLKFLDPLLTKDVIMSHTDVMISDMIIVVFTHFVICDQLCWIQAFHHIWRHNI